MVCRVILPPDPLDPNPGKGGVTSGYCTDCRTWHHDFNRRQMAGDPTATEAAFQADIAARRTARKPAA